MKKYILKEFTVPAFQKLTFHCMYLRNCYICAPYQMCVPPHFTLISLDLFKVELNLNENTGELSIGMDQSHKGKVHTSLQC